LCKNVPAHLKCTVFSFAVSGIPNRWRYAMAAYGGIRTRVNFGLTVRKEDLNLIDREFFETLSIAKSKVLQAYTLENPRAPK